MLVSIVSRYSTRHGSKQAQNNTAFINSSIFSLLGKKDVHTVTQRNVSLQNWCFILD